MKDRPVVFLHASDYCAGAERSLCDLASGLKARGHRVEVWNAGDNPTLAGWLAERDLPLRSLPVPKFGQRDVLGFLSLSLALGWRWLRRRPRLVHANSITSAKYAAGIAELMRVPLVAHVRDEPQLDDLTRRLLGKTNLVLAISHFIAGSLGEIPGTRIEVLYNAVDVAGIAVTAPASDPVRPLRLVTPAAFRRDKRIELLLDCAKLLSDSGCRFHWRICGPRPDAAYSADVEARHSELALEDCVSLEPSREHEELYRDANLVVSGSLREPFGRTVIEGHARGLPVVGFASGALPEVVEEGVTGLLVSDGDAAALAGAIASLESDRSRIVEMGRAGRAAAKRRFSLESLLDALETHHDSVA